MTILFDLDGTLTDSAVGILNSVRLVYSRFGIPLPAEDELRSFIGPPLEVTFPRYGIPAERVQEAIDVFRSRYVPIGKFENSPYPGIPEMLASLRSAGHRLCVATSKPEETAVEILAHFHLDVFFSSICGATMDSSRVSKSQVIEYLFQQYPCTGSNIVMVGDTAFDVIGASKFHIPTIGVSWGYGTVDEMTTAGAAAIAETPGHLLALLEHWDLPPSDP